VRLPAPRTLCWKLPVPSAIQRSAFPPVAHRLELAGLAVHRACGRVVLEGPARDVRAVVLGLLKPVQVAIATAARAARAPPTTSRTQRVEADRARPRHRHEFATRATSLPADIGRDQVRVRKAERRVGEAPRTRRARRRASGCRVRRGRGRVAGGADVPSRLAGSTAPAGRRGGCQARPAGRETEHLRERCAGRAAGGGRGPRTA
jgi:hypothetical protein